MAAGQTEGGARWATACALVFVGALIVVASAGAAAAPPRLRVSENHRFLVTRAGKPFFWLGDTAWWITRLRPEEVDFYLQRRARQGFNVVQIHCGRPVGDYAGRLPYRNGDALDPDEAYWRNVDSTVDRAGRRGLYVALVPLWGEEYGRLFGTDAARARRFGEWIGARYAGRTNVLWIVSGEYDSINGFRLPIAAPQRAVLVAAAEGIRKATGGLQIMTVHPGAARTSSLDFHREAWLDLNMLQSGHMVTAADYGLPENDALIAHDYSLKPPKPVLDGEPLYEDTPDGVWAHRSVDRPRGGADAVRRKAYWAVFAGACGHTYGHNDVYGFNVPRSPGYVQPLPEGPGNRGLWRTSLDAPGALQMKYLRRLIEGFPFLSQAPDLSFLVGDPGSGVERLGALRGDGYAAVYSPTGRAFRVRLGRLGGRTVRASWFDPRTGRSQAIGSMPGDGEREFDPPGQPAAGNDWALRLVVTSRPRRPELRR